MDRRRARQLVSPFGACSAPLFVLTASFHREAIPPSERKQTFIPTKFDALRNVPLYANGVRERFDRCLDLYLCPRTIKKRLNVSTCCDNNS